MLLQSARDLKSEVLASLIQPVVEEARLGMTDLGGLTSGAAAVARPLSVAAGSFEPRFHRSIALGIARRGSEFKLAIRVQRQALMGSAIIERLVAKAKGEVDLRLVGRIDKRPARRAASARALAAMPWNRSDVRPITLGASIGHQLVTAGTLGAFVKADGQSYVLSNNHVLANENNANQGDVILQRASADGGHVGAQSAALLQRWIQISKTSHNVVDAAIASVDPTVPVDPTLLKGIRNGSDAKLLGTAEVEAHAAVFKIGRTSGVTQGRVTAFEVDNIVVSYEMGDVTFDNTIEVESTTAGHFSDGGDSGALIVNEAMEGVGLLFAGSDTGGSNGLGVTYANSLLTVLAELKVDLIT
jgi:hypothetical protein